MLSLEAIKENRGLKQSKFQRSLMPQNWPATTPPHADYLHMVQLSVQLFPECQTWAAARYSEVSASMKRSLMPWKWPVTTGSSAVMSSWVLCPLIMHVSGTAAARETKSSGLPCCVCATCKHSTLPPAAPTARPLTTYIF